MKTRRFSLCTKTIACISAWSFFFAPVLGMAQEATETAAPLPPSALTLGTLYAEDYWEGTGDLLIPLMMTEDGLLFINPRTSGTDNDATEVNLGVGYRHLLRDRQAILGGNIFYDYRDTTYGARFHQFGAGIEYLSKYLDMRANVYVPTDTKKKVSEFEVTEEVTEMAAARYDITEYDDPYASGNSVFQPYTDSTVTRVNTTTTSTTRFFEQHEIAFWGWDAEIGTELPLPAIENYVRIKPFAGAVSYYGRSGVSDIESFRGRLEIHVRPSFFVDAVYLSDDALNGGHFSLAAYMTLPFDLANLAQGRNPFAGATERWTAGTTEDITWRMTDLVKRDPQIRASLTEPEEQEEKATTTTTTASEAIAKPTGEGTEVVATDVTFVDGESGDDANPGTYEQPKATVQGGVDDPRSMVFVHEIDGAYEENVVLTENVILRGSGAPILAFGGQAYGSGTHPILDGSLNPEAPTVEMTDNTTVQGFDIRHTAEPEFRTIGGTGEPTYSYGTGIGATSAENIVIADNRFSDVSDGVRIMGEGDLRVSLINNTFRDFTRSGATISGYGGSIIPGADTAPLYSPPSSTYFVEAYNNSFASDLMILPDGDISSSGKIRGAGLALDAFGYSTAIAVVDDLQASGIPGAGMGVYLQASDLALLSMGDIQASGNDVGVSARVEAMHGTGLIVGGMPQSLADLISDVGPSSPELESILRASGPIQANQNEWLGLDLSASGDFLGAIALFDTQANGNGMGGANLDVDSPEVAIGLVASGQSTMELAQLGDSLLAELGLDLGLPAFEIPATGPSQFNNNGSTMPLSDTDVAPLREAYAYGLNIRAEGDSLALAGGLGIEANNNLGDYGIGLRSVSDTGTAASLLYRAEAIGNAGDGMSVRSEGDFVAASVVLDANASQNQQNGIQLDAAGEIAIGVVASTDPLRNLAAIANQELELDPPIVMPGEPYGQVIASQNQQDGIQSSIWGDEQALGFFLDFQANENGNLGVDVDISSLGDASTYIGSSDPLFDDGRMLPGFGLGVTARAATKEPLEASEPEPIALPITMGPATATGNGQGGIAANTFAIDDSMALIAGVDASDNQDADGRMGTGIDIRQISDMGNIDFALYDITANNNAGSGIHVLSDNQFLSPIGSTRGEIDQVTANDNTGNGLSLVLFSENAGIRGTENTLTGNQVGLHVDDLSLLSDLTFSGNNAIFGNAGFDASYIGGGTLCAQNNWWGTATPDPGQFSGTIVTDPVLTAAPTP